MQKRLVRIASAILDLEPRRSGETKYQRLNDLHSGILKLDHNESTTDPSPLVFEAMKTFIERRPLFWHADQEAEELKTRISEYLGLSSDHISCFAGSSAAL